MIYALQRGIVAPKGTPKGIITYWADVFKKAAADPGFLKQMDAKGTGVEYVGPDGYRKWANKMYKDHEKLAIKIGIWKKK
jgi:tripartite-type tricarboxylate transporter receptor subunit TctC